MTLGGSSTTEMSLGFVELSGLTGLQRSSRLERLIAKSVTYEPRGGMSQIYLPFDNLEDLVVLERSYSDLVTLRPPPNAVNRTGGFALTISDSLGIRFSSMYGLDEQGNWIQTWYWPTNVSSICINGAVVANSFFYVRSTLCFTLRIRSGREMRLLLGNLCTVTHL